MAHSMHNHELNILQAESQLSLLPRILQEAEALSTDEEEFGRISHLRKWLPEVEPDTNTRWTKRLADRDVALLLIQLISVTILALNVALTVWATIKYGIKDNINDILGSGGGAHCPRVKSWNKGLHVGINTLSTLLLGASNYCAQLLVAPTRATIDNAHRQKRWLDIGVQSFRNLKRAPFKHQMTWILLMSSSGLLHLFWNSAVFATTPFSPYSYAGVTADFMNDQDPWNFPDSQDFVYIREKAQSLPRLSNAECIDRYAGKMAGLSSLLLVSANVSMDDRLSFDRNNNRSSLLFNATTAGSAIFWRMNSDWMCNKWNVKNRVSCTLKTMKSPYEDSWTLVRFAPSSNIGDDPMDAADDIWTKVNYCLPRDELRNMDDKCVLRISGVILAIVAVLNIVKCLCIAVTIRLHNRIRFNQRDESNICRKRGSFAQTLSRAMQVILDTKGDTDGKAPYIVTLGDAIASFLQNSDEYTRLCGSANKDNFAKRWPLHVTSSLCASKRWFRAASLMRWLITMTLCGATIGIVSVLLHMTMKTQQDQGIDTDLVSLASYGLGTPQQFGTALTGFTDALGISKGFFFSVLFANMFQALVSALYLLCNNLLTVMVVSAEWNSYISKRKTLRVSAPVGIQRSSYTLSLPYKYSITLMALSGVLHFLISQGVFVVQIVAYLPKYDPQRFERAPILDSSCIGFSSFGILLALAAGCVLVLYLLFVGFVLKYDGLFKAKVRGNESCPLVCPVPLVSTCSAAISANCHRHVADTDCVYLPLKWGYVRDANGGRYTFTTSSTAQ